MPSKLNIIAHLRNDYTTKFGVPRQSGIIESVSSDIVFEPEYRNPDALRGMEGFSHIWLIWGFSKAERDSWSPTVRPPRLGGNTRMGVFATRSPFRPNAIGLSCVRIEDIITNGNDAPIIRVSGADMMNGTPIYDIKPYLPYADCKPDATGGFASGYDRHRLTVEYAPGVSQCVPPEKLAALTDVLANDPRPAYQDDPERVYGMSFGGLNVRFTVADGTLTVKEVSADNNAQ